jgi:integrase
LDSAEAEDEDFGALVVLLAATGARFDQIARLTVADFQPSARRVVVPVAAKGDAEKQIPHIAVPLTEDVVTRIRALTAGRPRHESLLLRWHHRQVAGDPTRGPALTWEKSERRPWRHAGEMARMWDAALAAAKMPEGLVPYCLRHSSIVRQLRAGLPVSLVARVHDTSEAMIQKHYGAFIIDVSEELLRKAAMPLASRGAQ